MTTDLIFTTLAQIRSQRPCEDGYKELCTSLGGVRKYGKDTPVTFRQIFESNGYDDTLWCLRTVDPKWFPLWRHFACDAADDVRHLMTDPRSTNAIDVARRHADGLATGEARAAAWAAAKDAAWDAARDAAMAAAMAAARDAARAAAMAAAMAAAWAAAKDAAWDAQMNRLFEYCRTGQRVIQTNSGVIAKATGE